MRAALALLLFAVCAAWLLACARRVVVHPDDVERLNDRGWTVESEPAPGAAASSDGGAD